MKQLSEYITERMQRLAEGKTGIVVFDIDDTLLQADTSVINIYKKQPGKKEEILTTDQYAKDPDAEVPERKSWFDYRDFRDPVKVYKSIQQGTPIIRNLRIMDKYLNAGYDFCFLTARACTEIINAALIGFLRYKDESGRLRPLGDKFKKHLSAAINDTLRNYPGNSDAEKKGNVLKDLCGKYDNVVFVDDDIKNIRYARQLNIPNLKIIKAQKL